MEKLILERSSPVEGESVNVHVFGSNGHCGQVVLTYAEWLHFNKLIKEGQSSLKRKNEQRIEIEIKGLNSDNPPKNLVPITTRATTLPKRGVAPQGDLTKMANEILQEALDQEDEREIAKAEHKAKLVEMLKDKEQS